MGDVKSNDQPRQSTTKFVPTFVDQEYEFDYSNVGSNGFLLQNIYLPEEVLLHILSYVASKELLTYSLVCQNWKRLIRSETLWYKIYERRYNRKAKKLPWYLYYCFLSTNYFDTNLLDNKENVEHSNECYGPTIIFELEPANVGRFKIRTTNVFVLFIATKALVPFPGLCGKGRRYYKLKWLINLRKSQLLQHILDVYKPHICLTKWGSKYELQCGLLENDVPVRRGSINNYCDPRSLGEQFFTNEWLDLTITQYPEGIEGILLEQKYVNRSARFAKMGSAKFIFDSIEPVDKNKLMESNKLSGFEFISVKQPVEDLREDN